MFDFIFKFIVVVIVLLILSQLEYNGRKIQTYVQEYFKSFSGKKEVVYIQEDSEEGAGKNKAVKNKSGKSGAKAQEPKKVKMIRQRSDDQPDISDEDRKQLENIFK